MAPGYPERKLEPQRLSQTLLSQTPLSPSFLHVVVSDAPVGNWPLLCLSQAILQAAPGHSWQRDRKQYDTHCYQK